MIHLYFQNVESGYGFFPLQTSANFKQKVLLLKKPNQFKIKVGSYPGDSGVQPHWDDLSGLYLSPHCLSSHGPCQRPAQTPPKPPAPRHKKPQQGFVSPRLQRGVWTAGADCRKLCWWKLAVPPKCRSPAISFPR